MARSWKDRIAARDAAQLKQAADDRDNDHETLIRVTCPQDVYDALDLLHTRCMDHLDPNTVEEHVITATLSRFLDEMWDLVHGGKS
jgi:hypothetical protein